MRRHYMILVLMIAGVLLLSSCSAVPLGQRLTGLYDNDDAKAAYQLEQVIEAVKAHEKEALKAAFSKQALSEAVDIDEQIGHLFEFVQGSVQSWKNYGGGSSSGNYDHGDKLMNFGLSYTVTTDVNEYVFVIETYTQDTKNPDNVGIYMLRVTDESNISGVTGPWEELRRPGIWIPDPVQEE